MIIYEDKELVVCIKPKGVLSQAGKEGQKSMIDILSAECDCEIYPVHRLDKEVSGIMVYAKTKSSAADLSAQVSNREMEKHYIATTEKSTLDSEGVMEDLLYFDKGKNKSFVVKKERKGVKKAILEYKEISSDEAYSSFLVRLLTGRTHQIRVQFASRKHPLIGDRKYGSKLNCDIGLVSCFISFRHPNTKEIMEFTHPDYK
ncbi:MAG: RluA family pseudouridine synthase [Clostridia bacterium]|nr:RluA family pseudouridine synthase [Clostridia bacterium]